MNQPMQDGLADALRRLREDSAEQAAPDALEGKLLEAFRAHHTTPQKQRNWVWVAASIAACLVVAFILPLRKATPVQAPPAPVAAVRQQQPARSEKNTVQTAVVAKPRPTTMRRARPAGARSALTASRPAAEQQEFVRIPYAPPFTPYDEAYVVRVNMPGASVRRMGVPVMMDRVQADLVVGNDGLPRAIRVVSY